MLRRIQLLLPAAILAILILTLIPLPSSAEQITVPKPAFQAKLAKGLILYPRLSTPAFLEPGSKLTIILSKQLPVKKVILDDGFGHRLEFNVGKTVDKIEVEIPASVHLGLYDLIIVSGKGAFGEPNAVYITSKKMMETIYIFHVTDRHYGVINGNGRAASNYDLAAAMIALALPNNTIVVDTGDIADNAAAPEYEESLGVDTLLNKPMLAIPGNHDHVGGSRLYGVFRGYYNYTMSIFGIYRVVAIDSGAEGYIDTGQAKWAKGILLNVKEPVTIVLFHHPHFTHIYGNKPIVFNVPSAEELYKLLLSKKPNSRYPYIYSSWLTNRQALKELVEGIYNCPSKLVLVLSGHIHMDSYAKVVRKDGTVIQYVVTTATGGSVRTYRNDYHGFRVIKVSADGAYKIYGDGDPWNLHASFNLENTTVSITYGPNAVAVQFTLGDSAIVKLMNRTVVALPIPSSYYGKKVNVYMKGLERILFRCTPLHCIAYGIASSKPKIGETYLLALYTKPDEQPPTITVKSVSPSKPIMGAPVTIRFTVSDDSWGVAQVYAKVTIAGKTYTLMPAKFGSTYMLVIPKHNATEASVKIVAVDASGKAATKTLTVKYQERAATTSPTTTVRTTATTTTTTTIRTVIEQTATTTVTTVQTTTTTLPPQTTTVTPAALPATTTAAKTTGVSPVAIAVAGTAIIVGVILAVITLRRL